MKTHSEVFEPWTKEISFDLPDTSFVQFQIKAETADSMSMRLYEKGKT